MAIEGLALISGAPPEGLGLGPQEERIASATQAFGPPSAPVEARRLGRTRVLYLSRHGPNYAIAPHRINFRANLRALADAGARCIIGVHTVGGIAPEAVPGTVVIPRDLIDYTHSRATSFAAHRAGKSAFIEFAAPFDADLREALAVAAGKSGYLTEGVYGVTQGPRLETAAEVERLARDGCTLVGMTLMPEAVLARELGIRYASISLVSNYAAGRQPPQETAGILEQYRNWTDTALARARKLLNRAVRDLDQAAGIQSSPSGLGR